MRQTLQTAPAKLPVPQNWVFALRNSVVLCRHQTHGIADRSTFVVFAAAIAPGKSSYAADAQECGGDARIPVVVSNRNSAPW